MARPISVVQIFFAAVCVYFVACGWVPFDILSFPILSSVYIFLLSRHVVPPVTSKVEPGLFAGSRILRNYVVFAGVIGLILPLGYIICAFLQGDVVALQESVPALFLLICQVLSENFTYSRPQFSVLIRALVPILYNTRRLFCIWSWTLFLFREKPEVSSSTAGLVLFGQVVAVANAILWNYNLFGFLVPVVLPKSMRQYYDLEQKAK